MRQASSSEQEHSEEMSPDRESIQQALEKAVNEGRRFTKNGRVATYIPELSKADSEQIGACIKTVKGETDILCGQLACTFYYAEHIEDDISYSCSSDSRI